MTTEERKIQLRLELAITILVIVFLLGGAVGAMFYIKYAQTTTKASGQYNIDFTSDFSLEESDLVDDMYDTYVKFMCASYIILGDSIETAEIYKISANVARHDYDVSSFILDEDSGYMSYVGENVTTVKLGIDVSSFQNDIDWETVATTEVDFAMIRLGYRGYSEGGLVLDSSYVTNITGALKNGIPVGVYFFTQATSYEEGVEEAEFVLANIAGYDVTYPIVIDTEQIEVDGARANDIDNDTRTDAIIGFCETIIAAGYTPMIYANRNWFVQNLDMDRLGDYKLWLAQYAETPYFPYLFNCWQYSSEGVVPGISEAVDVNIWLE